MCIVKSNFVILNGNEPPKLYVSTPQDIIKTFTRYKNYLAALGYLFEVVEANNLPHIVMMIWEIGKAEKIAVELDLQFSLARI